jgi:hypothetical protein
MAELKFYVCLHTALQTTTAPPEDVFSSWRTSWGRHVTSSGPPRTLELSHWFGHLLLHRRNASAHQHLSPEALHELNQLSWRESANIVSQFVRHDASKAPDLPDFAFFIASYAALVLCESAIDHHLVDNLRAYFFRVACGESHIAFKHGCIIQRALQRSRHAETNAPDVVTGNSTNVAQPSGADMPFEGQAAHTMGLNDFDALAGFDIFGEYFTADSLL